MREKLEDHDNKIARFLFFCAVIGGPFLLCSLAWMFTTLD